MALPTNELAVQIRATAAFIAADPTTLTLRPYTKDPTDEGGYRMVPGPERAPQELKVIWLSDGDRPTLTVDGEEAVADIVLLGPPDAEIVKHDRFILDGREGRVLWIEPGYGYETKALAVLRG